MAFTIYINDQLFSGTNTSYKTVAGESGVFLHDKVTNRYWIFYVKKVAGPPLTYNLCETHNDKLGVDPDDDWSDEAIITTGIENCILDKLQEDKTHMLIVTYVKKVGADYKFYTATSTPAQSLGVTWTHTAYHTIV